MRQYPTELVSKDKVKRIVTTLPSATEIVCLLGLEDKLVGITHECDYPPSVQKKKVVVMRSKFDTQKMTSKQIDESVLDHVSRGMSIYEINEKLLRDLNPDLIITQELCEVCATPLQVVARAIKKLNPQPRILSLSPRNLEDVLQNVLEVAQVTGEIEKGRAILGSLTRRIEQVKSKCLDKKVSRPSVFCLEWLDPLYCSGHWMPELVEYAGGREILGRFGEPSFVTQWEKVVELDPEVIFVTVCGYHVERTLSEIHALTTRRGWNDLFAVRKGRVYILDSPAYYSRSGPRLVDGLEIMAALLHPDLFPDYCFPNRSVYSITDRKFVSNPPKRKSVSFA